jgi:hypothetical protein
VCFIEFRFKPLFPCSGWVGGDSAGLNKNLNYSTLTPATTIGRILIAGATTIFEHFNRLYKRQIQMNLPFAEILKK